MYIDHDLCVVALTYNVDKVVGFWMAALSLLYFFFIMRRVAQSLLLAKRWDKWKRVAIQIDIIIIYTGAHREARGGIK